MQKIIIALVVFGSATASSVASNESEVLAPVHQFVDSFNKGDVTTAPAGCSDVTSIIDDFPPFGWQGAGACAKWMDSYKTFAAANGIADMVITLENPKHVDIVDDRAYVVVPANYTLKKAGKIVKKTGSILTIALLKGASGWHITAWAWADG
jgi:hypothetical protein